MIDSLAPAAKGAEVVMGASSTPLMVPAFEEELPTVVGSIDFAVAMLVPPKEALGP